MEQTHRILWILSGSKVAKVQSKPTREGIYITNTGEQCSLPVYMTEGSNKFSLGWKFYTLIIFLGQEICHEFFRSWSLFD